MSTRVYEINSGRYIGIDMIEIKSFPSCDEKDLNTVSSRFSAILNELHKLGGGNAAYEMIWATEPVLNQVFCSKIHIYLVIRKIGSNALALASEVEQLRLSAMISLTNMNFVVELSDISNELLESLLFKITGKTMFAVLKKENCIIHENGAYPYYYCDIIPGNNMGNFSAIISTLSTCKECMISFQLFPDYYNSQEQLALHSVTSDLNKITTGIMLRSGQFYKDALAEEPLKVLSYYNGNSIAPMFMYNILVMGDRVECANVTTKVISHLQEGTNKIATCNFSVMDLSEERIDLKKMFVIYGWNINELLLKKYRNMKYARTMIAMKLPRLSYLISMEEATVFFRLPYYEETMYVLENNRNIHIQEKFEDGVIDKNNIQFGTLISNDRQKIEIGCKPRIFTKHALVVGMPGTGKTTFSVYLLLQMYKKGIPFLAVEPTKTEYRAMIDAIPELQIFTPGNNRVSPFMVNPFIPPRDITVEQYIPSLASAFKAAFSMPSPLDNIFQEAIQASYIKYGWRDYSTSQDKNVVFFGLHEFILVFKELINRSTYSAEIKGNLQSGGIVRLRNLIEQNANIYDTTKTIPLEDLLSKPTVLELNAIDNEEQKSVLMALLLINICVYTKHNNIGDGKLKNLILIDEAHVLFKVDITEQGSSSTVRSLENMLAEIRSYGTSIVIADQSPSAVGSEVVKNTDIKVTFRLTNTEDRKIIEASTGMTSEMEQSIPKLGVGQAFISYSLLKTPVMVQTPDIRKEEHIRLSVSNIEVHERMEYWDTHAEYLIPFNECAFSDTCNTCALKVRSDATFYAAKFIQEYGHKVIDVITLRKALNTVNKWIEKQSNYGDEQIRLTNCIKIRLMRKLLQQKDIRLNENEYRQMLSIVLSHNQENENV